jgi:endoglucanase
VRDFGACFAGMTPDEAEDLAGSFAFQECARRERLAEILHDA